MSNSRLPFDVPARTEMYDHSSTVVVDCLCSNGTVVANDTGGVKSLIVHRKTYSTQRAEKWRNQRSLDNNRAVNTLEQEGLTVW